MKIARIDCTIINVPLDKPYYWSYGELDGFTKTIIEVTTDDGITGLGEAPGAGSAKIIEGFKERLIGRDAIDIRGCEEVCLPPWHGAQSWHDRAGIAAFGGFEVALWDIRGKAWGEPIHKLLGGACRKDIPFTDYFAYRPGEETPEAVAEWCVRLNAEFGTTFFEGKVSSPHWRTGVKMLEAIRKKLGDEVMLRIDSNQAYTVNDAREMAVALERLGVRNWEDPVSSLHEMKQLRQFTSVPFSGHDLDLRSAADLGVPTTICTDPTSVGGITRFMRFAAAAEAMDVGLWCYSGDSGILSTAYLHVIAAAPNIREPSQSLFRWQPHDVIAEGPLCPRNNVVRVPDGPGLGVTLDRDKLKFLARHFETNGAHDKYRDGHGPGHYRRLPFDTTGWAKDTL